MVRQLTAIMFTDMVGYTALMQDDEARAKSLRDRHRTILKDHVAERNGRILQFYGDGTLSVFQSAIEAVECGIAIQRTFGELDPPLEVRIGVHTGDVIHDDEGVFGDGVNVAARIQGLSIPGGLLISEKVFDEVKNQPSIETTSLGRFSLKNVKRPMEVHAVVGGGLHVPSEEHLAPARAGGDRSVAVLPFVNLSPDPENEYFSDGITEEIIASLSRINGLQVTARTSSFAFKGHRGDIREVAQKLGVSHVLEGSVRTAGNRVRVLAQLNCASDGMQLLSQTFDRTLDDVFDVQDEIADAIVTELAGHLGRVQTAPSTDDGGSITRSFFTDPEAYAEYLRGRFQWARRTAEGARMAVSHYRRAVKMDPTASLPRSAMATAYVFLGSMGYMDPDDAFARAETEATRAIELEPHAGESHLAMASVRLFYKWEWNGAYRSFQKALSLTPGSAEAHQLYSAYLRATDDGDEAVDEARVAVQLDPLSLTAHTTLAKALLFADRLEEAEEQAVLVLAMEPSYHAATEVLAQVRLVQGRPEEALEALQDVTAAGGDQAEFAGTRGCALAALGRDSEARKMLFQLLERSESEPNVSLAADFSLVYMALGDFDRMYEQLEQARERRLGFLVFLARHPLWSGPSELRGERFRDFLRDVTPDGVPV